MCTHIHILYHAIQNKLINNVKFILNLLTNTYYLQNKKWILRYLLKINHC